MPYKRRGSFRRGLGLRPIDSMKNVVMATLGLTTTSQQVILALAVESPASTTQNEIQRGSIIKAVWLSIDFCGLAATGVLQRVSVFLAKNPGANLTFPDAFSVGTSNEKKFVFKQWTQMTMRNQDGNPPYHWEGWVKIPKRYQRFGTDDTLAIFAETDSVTGHFGVQCIYKWYR